MEFVIGGMAAASAGFFTNPLEVLKIRMQLQGELKPIYLIATNVLIFSHSVPKNRQTHKSK